MSRQEAGRKGAAARWGKDSVQSNQARNQSSHSRNQTTNRQEASRKEGHAAAARHQREFYQETGHRNIENVYSQYPYERFEEINHRGERSRWGDDNGEQQPRPRGRSTYREDEGTSHYPQQYFEEINRGGERIHWRENNEEQQSRPRGYSTHRGAELESRGGRATVHRDQEEHQGSLHGRNSFYRGEEEPYDRRHHRVDEDENRYAYGRTASRGGQSQSNQTRASQSNPGRMSRQEAGRKGGQSVAATHSREFYQQIGSKGGRSR